MGAAHQCDVPYKRKALTKYRNGENPFGTVVHVIPVGIPCVALLSGSPVNDNERDAGMF